MFTFKESYVPHSKTVYCFEASSIEICQNPAFQDQARKVPCASQALELPSPEEGEPPGKHPGTPGISCHLCHLPPPMHWVQTWPCSKLWAWMSSVLPTSFSDAPSSRPHIQSSTLWAAAEDWVAPLNPWGFTGPLAFIFYSIRASTIAEWPSWWWCSPLPVQLSQPN